MSPPGAPPGELRASPPTRRVILARGLDTELGSPEHAAAPSQSIPTWKRSSCGWCKSCEWVLPVPKAGRADVIYSLNPRSRPPGTPALRDGRVLHAHLQALSLASLAVRAAEHRSLMCFGHLSRTASCVVRGLESRPLSGVLC